MLIRNLQIPKSIFGQLNNNSFNLGIIMGTNEGISNGPKEVVVDLIAGSLGAIASVYVGQPMDTLKVKMQTFPHLYPSVGKCLR